MAFHLAFIFSLLLISMVESRTLSEILEKAKPRRVDGSSRPEAGSVMVNRGLPTNLEPDAVSSHKKASRIKHIKQTSSLKPIRTTDATPIAMKANSAKPIWFTEYKPTWLIDNPDQVIKGADDIIDDAGTARVIDQREGTATFETEPTLISVSNSTSSSTSLTEPLINCTQLSLTVETPSTNMESAEYVKSAQVNDESRGMETVTEPTPTIVAGTMMRNLPNEVVYNYSIASSGLEELPETETISGIYTDSVEVNADKLSATSSHKPIKTTDATLISVTDPSTKMSLEPGTNYTQENSETKEESTEYAEPTQSSVIEETKKTSTESENVEKVPRAIGAHVFYGKMVSGSEMYNMTSDEYYRKIYPTNNCDVFLVGKLLKVADTPHNRMIFAKFSDEESRKTSDDSSEEEVPLDD
nr:PREDICTED: uncharacterized protein LOC108198797 [Daucus carota subsp. sativus]